MSGFSRALREGGTRKLPRRGRGRGGLSPRLGSAQPCAACGHLRARGPRCPHLSPRLALALAAVSLVVFPGTYLCAPLQVPVSLARKGSERSSRATRAHSPSNPPGLNNPGLRRGGVRRKISSSRFVLLRGWIAPPPPFLLGGAKTSEALIAFVPVPPLPVRLGSACSQAQPFDPTGRGPPRELRLVPPRAWLRGGGGTSPRPLPAAFPGPREPNGDILARQALSAAASPSPGRGPPGNPLPSPGRASGSRRAQGGPHVPGGRAALELTCPAASSGSEL